MCSRKTLIYLILTLNHCYPDYDFSLLRAHHFKKELGVGAVEEAVDSHLLEVSRVCSRGCTLGLLGNLFCLSCHMLPFMQGFCSSAEAFLTSRANGRMIPNVVKICVRVH